MSVLYSVLVVSTVIVLVVGIGLFVRVRRFSRASESQFRRLVRDEDTAAKTGTDTH